MKTYLVNSCQCVFFIKIFDAEWQIVVYLSLVNYKILSFKIKFRKEAVLAGRLRNGGNDVGF